MKPRFLDRSYRKTEPFVIKRNRYPNFLKIWHYHPELELVLIIEGTGTRFAGGSIEKFEPGELVLLGKNLPHMWLNDDPYFDESSGLFAEALCIHFREDFLGEKFLEIAGTEHLSLLLKKATRGIRFQNLSGSIIDEIQQVAEESCEFTRLMKVLNILHQLAKHKEIALLSSEGYLNLAMGNESDKTHEYIFKNFNKPIQLSDVAAIAQMNPSAFSRYFRRVHRKTFSRYLIEVRISFACKLLMENKYNISAICYKSGFNNISNFNKQFRRIMDMSPSAYLKLHNSD